MVPASWSEKTSVTFASKPASSTAATASAVCSPTTSGTSPLAGPLETVSRTVSPSSSSVPPSGSLLDDDAGRPLALRLLRLRLEAGLAHGRFSGRLELADDHRHRVRVLLREVPVRAEPSEDEQQEREQIRPDQRRLAHDLFLVLLDHGRLVDQRRVFPDDRLLAPVVADDRLLELAFGQIVRRRVVRGQVVRVARRLIHRAEYAGGAGRP